MTKRYSVDAEKLRNLIENCTAEHCDKCDKDQCFNSLLINIDAQPIDPNDKLTTDYPEDEG